MSALASILRRFGQSARGTATVEFVIVFPIFVALFLSSFEASMVLLRQLMLERALDITMREVRLNPADTFPRPVLRRTICDTARILPDCEASLTVELTTIDPDSYAMPSTRTPCVDRGGSASSGGDIASGEADELIVVRVCYSVRPFFPTSMLGTELVRDNANAGEFQIMAASAFTQEPGEAP